MYFWESILAIWSVSGGMVGLVCRNMMFLIQFSSFWLFSGGKHGFVYPRGHLTWILERDWLRGLCQSTWCRNVKVLFSFVATILCWQLLVEKLSIEALMQEFRKNDPLFETIPSISVLNFDYVRAKKVAPADPASLEFWSYHWRLTTKWPRKHTLSVR